MEALADHGNGQYAYIDSQIEAQRALVEQAGGTLITVAKDVKIQVEFNPEFVSSYRLIGYENRLLAAEDFRDDSKDAGEIGAGHSVVALYELVPPGVGDTVRPVDPLKYQRREVNAAAAQSGEVATVKLRFKQPDGEASVERAIVAYDAGGSWMQASSELRFAAAVASFGMILRDSPQRGTATLALVNQLAQSASAFDPNGHRAAFLAMVAKTQPLLATPIASAE
jgi:Ca-activated chloride channel family protein